MTARVALITGGGTGVGKAVAIALAARGYVLALAGRRREKLLEAVREAEAAGAQAIAIAADVTDEFQVARLFEAIIAQFGRLDLLFNNAGLSAPMVPLEALTLAAWRNVVDVNLTSAFLCLREAFRVMKVQTPQGGRIINNGSLSAQVPRPNSAPYTASKHALTGLTKTASLDGRKYNIACGQIDIGPTVTEMAAMAALGVPQANGTIMPEPMMEARFVGEAVAYMDSLPLEANVQFMTVLPTKAPFVGRG